MLVMRGTRLLAKRERIHQVTNQHQEEVNFKDQIVVENNSIPFEHRRLRTAPISAPNQLRPSRATRKPDKHPIYFPLALIAESIQLPGAEVLRRRLICPSRSRSAMESKLLVPGYDTIRSKK
jgi:hypothetical protein